MDSEISGNPRISISGEDCAVPGALNSNWHTYIVKFKIRLLDRLYYSLKSLVENGNPSGVSCVYHNALYGKSMHFIVAESPSAIYDSIDRSYISKIYRKPIEKQQELKILEYRTSNRAIAFKVGDHVMFNYASSYRYGIIKKFIDQGRRALVNLQGEHMLMIDVPVSTLSMTGQSHG